MRKGFTIVSVLAIILVGFMAMANPVAANEGVFEFSHRAIPRCCDFTNEAVPASWNARWLYDITVVPDQDMYNVNIKDRLGSELEVDDVLPGYPGNLVLDKKGKSEMVFINWYIDVLWEGDTAILEMWISSDVNPGGQQEYHTPGDYELTSCVILRYEDFSGKKYVKVIGTIFITVIPWDD